MRFREHGLDKPTIHGDRAAIVRYLRDQFAHWPDLDRLDPANIQSEDLGLAIVSGANKHAWWRAWPAMHLVTLQGYGVVGYTDQALL
jgi:hypothetical protein